MAAAATTTGHARRRWVPAPRLDQRQRCAAIAGRSNGAAERRPPFEPHRHERLRQAEAPLTQGNASEARQALTSALEHLQAALGPDHPATRRAVALDARMKIAGGGPRRW